GTVNDKINPKPVDATAGSYSGVYDGNTHALSACVVTGFAGLSCTNNPTGPVGPGVSSGVVTPDTSSISSNFTVTPHNGSYSITKANANCGSVAGYEVTYDGNPHTATGACLGVDGNPLAGLDLSGTTHTNAGTYNNDPWTFTDVTGNYNNTSGTVNDKINPKPVDATAGSYSGVYDGNTHALSACVVTAFAGLNSTNNPTGPVGPGVSSWVVTPDTSSISSNFTVTPHNGSYSITKANANCGSVAGYEVTYPGNPHSPTGACLGVDG